MAANAYVVTAHKATAVTSCVTGKLLLSIVESKLVILTNLLVLCIVFILHFRELYLRKRLEFDISEK